MTFEQCIRRLLLSQISFIAELSSKIPTYRITTAVDRSVMLSDTLRLVHPFFGKSTVSAPLFRSRKRCVSFNPVTVTVSLVRCLLGRGMSVCSNLLAGLSGIIIRIPILRSPPQARKIWHPETGFVLNLALRTPKKPWFSPALILSGAQHNPYSNKNRA